MKKLSTVAVIVMVIALIIGFTGLMKSPLPENVAAKATNSENLIFTFIDNADTTASGDSLLAVTNFTNKDEIRFAWKIFDMKVVNTDTIMVMQTYTDSLTYSSAGYVAPATWTYGDDYFIVWRDRND